MTVSRVLKVAVNPEMAFEFTCLCHRVTLSGSFAKGKELPLAAEFCHCNSCRHSSGALAGAFVDLEGPPSNDVLKLCTEYESSEKVRRYFCSRCGSHMFLRGWSGEANGETNILWFAWAGVMADIESPQKSTELLDMIKITTQAFVNDTKDGGLVGRMAEIQLASSKNESGTPAIDANGSTGTIFADIWDGPRMTSSEIQYLVQQSTESRQRVSGSEPLAAECHCGKVRFHVNRSDTERKYDGNVQRFLRDNNRKYLARLCLCQSCRSSTGNPFHAWTYVPPADIVDNETGRPLPLGCDSQEGGWQRYRSKNALWSHCGTCGATLFFERPDRPWIIDIPVGILRSDAGALAADHLEWEWTSPTWRQDCRVPELLKSITGDAD